MTTMQEIIDIQAKQVSSMENKLRWISENVEEIITQMRVKQAETLKEYALKCDKSKNGYHGVYSLWRGSSIDNYVMNNLFSGRYKDSGEYISELRRDLEARGVEV